MGVANIRMYNRKMSVNIVFLLSAGFTTNTGMLFMVKLKYIAN